MRGSLPGEHQFEGDRVIPSRARKRSRYPETLVAETPLRCLTGATAAEHTTRRTRPMTSLVAHSGSSTYQSWKGTNSRINAAASKTQRLTIWWRSGWGIAASNFSSACIPAAPQRDPLPNIIHGPISTGTGSLRVETIQPGPHRTRLNGPTWPAWHTPVWR